jgi:hypothetical protein
MRKIDLGQTIAILANLGVIAGIVFLGVELQQNNRLLSAEAQYGRRQIDQARVLTLVESGELSDILVRARSGEELSEPEEFRLFLLSLNWIQDWEWKYEQIQAGNLADDGTLLRDIERSFRNSEAYFIPERIFRRAWEIAISARDPEFAHYVESNVLYQLE